MFTRRSDKKKSPRTSDSETSPRQSLEKTHDPLRSPKAAGGVSLQRRSVGDVKDLLKPNKKSAEIIDLAEAEQSASTLRSKRMSWKVGNPSEVTHHPALLPRRSQQDLQKLKVSSDGFGVCFFCFCEPFFFFFFVTRRL